MRLTFRFFVSNINFNKKEVIVAMKELLERVLEFLSQMPNYPTLKSTVRIEVGIMFINLLMQ